MNPVLTVLKYLAIVGFFYLFKSDIQLIKFSITAASMCKIIKQVYNIILLHI
jgi:hypothetical protein